MKKERFTFIKVMLLILAAVACFYVDVSFAALGISGIARNIMGSFGPLAKLITGGSFLAGLGFAFAAILKFKAHRDNPTQIPIGTPIALILVAGALLYLPFLFGQVGVTLFGSASQFGVGGFSGIIIS